MKIPATLSICFALCLFVLSSQAGFAANPEGEGGLPLDHFTTIEGEDDDLYPANREQLAKRGLRFVTEKYGAPALEEGAFVYAAEERFKPWSSWFFPLTKDELFQGTNSPLEKFDAAVYALSSGQTRTAAAEFHARNVYNAHASDWAGFCAQLAYASVFDGRLRAIKTPKRIGGVCFTPYDLKALSILTYEKVDASQWNGRFGQRFENIGPQSRGAVARDIYPAEWHRFVQAQLGERRIPFVMDGDASPAVWKFAVYHASGKVSRDPGRAEVALVSMTVQYARTQLSQKEQLRDKTENVMTIAETRTYFYELYGKWSGKSFRGHPGGINGKWAGKQRIYHPDFVEELPGDGDIVGKGSEIVNANRGSINPELKLELVDGILNEAMRAPACVP